jgi:hypothetical protein
MHKNLLYLIAGLFLFACADSDVKEPVDCSISDLEIEVVKIVYTDCGRDNGQITVSASGGRPPYQFSLDEGPLQSSPIITNVKPGFREITVVDADKCTKRARTFMSSKDPFQVVIYTTPSGCDDSKGSITVVPLGGVAPYKYQLGENNDNYQSENVWNGLRSGQHSIWVEDANRCFFGVFVSVPTGTSFSKTIAPIIESNCATPSCHGGTQAPDFRTFAMIKTNATKIKSMVIGNTAHPEGTLLPEEILQIVCWVDDGALNN